MNENTPQLNNHIELYSADQVARMISVSRDTVFKWCKAGKLAHYKVEGKRGSVRISLDDLKAFMAARKVAANI